MAAAPACHRHRRRLLRPRPGRVAQGNHVDDGTWCPCVRRRRPRGAARGRARQLRDARRRKGLSGLQGRDPGPGRRGSGQARHRRGRVPAPVRGDGEHPQHAPCRTGSGNRLCHHARHPSRRRIGALLPRTDLAGAAPGGRGHASRRGRARGAQAMATRRADRPAGRRRRGHAARDAHLPRRRPGAAGGELEHGGHGHVGGGEAPRGHPVP